MDFRPLMSSHGPDAPAAACAHLNRLLWVREKQECDWGSKHSSLPRENSATCYRKGEQIICPNKISVKLINTSQASVVWERRCGWDSWDSTNFPSQQNCQTSMSFWVVGMSPRGRSTRTTHTAHLAFSRDRHTEVKMFRKVQSQKLI